MLRQSTDEDLDRVDAVELLNSILGEDVHHPGRQTTIWNDGDVLPSRFRVEFLLFEDDLSVAAKIAEMHTRFDSELCKIEIEVVWNRAHHGVALTHDSENRLVIANVERSRNQS